MTMNSVIKSSGHKMIDSHIIAVRFWSLESSGVVEYDREKELQLRLQLHGAIYRPNSFVLMLSYCENFESYKI